MAFTIFFYVVAAFTLFSAYFVVTAHNLFRCAMGLIAVLLGVAAMYLLMDAQFLSAVQVTVYIGGIVVLIVFAILLISDVTQKVFRQCAGWRKGVAGAATVGLAALILGAGLSFPFVQKAGAGPRSASIAEIGRAFLSPRRDGYVLPFEVISLLLLAALVGAITIARSDNPEETGSGPRQQTSTGEPWAGAPADHETGPRSAPPLEWVEAELPKDRLPQPVSKAL